MFGLIFTYVMTYFGAAVALFNPFVGLLIYVSFAILKPGFGGTFHGSVPAGNYSRTVAIALLIGWAIQGFGNWSFGKARGIATAILFFLGWAIFGAVVVAKNQTVAWEWIDVLWKIVVPVVVGLSLIDSVAQLKALAWVIVLSLGYVAYDFHYYWYSLGINRVRDEAFGGMDNNSVAIGMVTGVGLAFFLALGSPTLWRKGVALIAGLLMAHVVLFSYSRGGMLALILTAFIGFLLTPRQPFHYLIFALAVIIVMSLAGEGVRARFMTTFADPEQRDESANSRVKLWKDNLDLMFKNPAFGVGPHQWPEVAPQYLDHKGKPWDKGKEGHSLWLQIGAELGFPGLISLFLFYALCIIRLWPITWKSSVVPDPWLRDAARMVFASLVGFAAAAQFVSLTFLEVPYYVTLLGAGVLKLTSAAAVPQKQAEPENAPQAAEYLLPAAG